MRHAKLLFLALNGLKAPCGLHRPLMANSRFEYVKNFEIDDQILPQCWIVVRLDGKGFTKYALNTYLTFLHAI